MHKDYEDTLATKTNLVSRVVVEFSNKIWKKGCQPKLQKSKNNYYQVNQYLNRLRGKLIYKDILGLEGSEYVSLPLKI